VRDRGRLALTAALVAGPFALAFFSGGYFDEPRLYAGLAACALLVAAALVSRRPLPGSAPGRLALAGLALLTAWTAASIAWAPLSSPAVADADRLLLYLAGFAAALAALDTRAAIRVLEPGIALGALAIVLYGLSERLLPGVFDIPRDATALGRLSRPLTYWNAMGATCALGLVLATRVAGDATRQAWMRPVAAAAAVPLGVGVYLSFSRGAIAAVVAGLVVLALIARERAQIRALPVTLVPALVACVVAGLLDGVRALEGPLGTREGEGAAMLAVLLGLMAAAGLAQRALVRRDAATAGHVAPMSSRASRFAAAGFVVVVVAGFTLAATSSERRAATPAGATSARLVSVESVRGDYWRIALDAFAEHPLRGLGSGGFAVVWLREREIPQGAVDAHSLYVETAAELGLVGLAALAVFLAGLAWGAVRAYRRDPVASAGLIAATSVWLLHAGLDWLWEMPAVTLPVLLMAAAVLRLAE
jgi:O-antigen ligase